MALVNHSKREINAKLVYFGAAGSGKKETLQYIYSRIRSTLRGEMKNSPAAGENLLCFDFSPFEAPLPTGYRIRFHVYTLSGAVSNPAAWRMMLKGVDGLVVVMGDQLQSGPALDCIVELRDYLGAYGVSLQNVPCVLQLGSSTDISPSPLGQTAAMLGLPDAAEVMCDLQTGSGILDALNIVSRRVMERVSVEARTAETEPAAPALSSESEEYDADGNTLERSHPSTVDIDIPPAKFECEDSVGVRLCEEGVSLNAGVLSVPVVIGDGTASRRLVVRISVEGEQ